VDVRRAPLTCMTSRWVIPVPLMREPGGIPTWTGRMRPIRRRWARRSCRLHAHVVCPWATPRHPSDQPTCWSRAGTWCSHQGATGSLTSPAFWGDASGTSPRGQPPRMDAGLLVGSAPARLTVRWLVVTLAPR
jgi:hypothetical protein